MKRYVWKLIVSEIIVLALWGGLVFELKICENHCNVASVVLSLLTLMGSVAAAYIAWYQWIRASEVKKAETLMELLKVLKDDDICKNVHRGLDDVSKSAMQVWYERVMQYPELRDKAHGTVRFICYLQYLNNQGLIGSNEEILFRATIESVINNEWFQRFLQEESISNEMRQTIMSIKGYKVYKADSEIGTVDGIMEEKVNEFSVDEIDSSQFRENTMIIKINRRYYENITASDLYEATRGWWRVNVDNAKKMKFVLSVANGVVREVYDNIDWCETDEESGRSAFTGKATEDPYWRGFIGKSVKKLFTKGESHPVKYFYAK